MAVLRDVVAVVSEPVAAFELGVLAEVFGLDRTGDGLPGYAFAVAAMAPGRVTTTSGFGLDVVHDLRRCRTADLVAVPSWSDHAAEPPTELVAALHEALDRGARLLAVCSGAFLLAAAGLLDGRRAATHWRYAPELAARYPAVTVDADVLYVEDGPIVTSAGTAAAIDACLHLVRREHGAAVATALARRMVVAPHRSGGQAQFAQTPVPTADDTGLDAALRWAAAHLDEPLTVAALARHAGCSERTFARRFVAATGVTPHRWLTDQRLLLAERLLEETDLGVDDVARRSGWGGPDALRHHFAKRRRVSPTAYRAMFHKA